MGRPKGTKNKAWTINDKIRIAEKYNSTSGSLRQISEEEVVNPYLVRKWAKQYLVDGEKAFIDKRHEKGNPFAALHRSKDLSEVKKLQLQVARLEIEVERLKKGYAVKGDGQKKEFIPTKEKNSK